VRRVPPEPPDETARSLGQERSTAGRVKGGLTFVAARWKMTHRPVTDRERTTAIRGWAGEHGHKVADRGRIPANVIQAYEKAAG